MEYSLLFSALSLVAGLLVFFMGFVILRESPRSPVNRATALMLFSGALGSILGALGQLLEPGAEAQPPGYTGYLRSFAYLWEFFFPSLLYFALVFPFVSPLLKRRRAVVELVLYVPHILHLTLILLLSESSLTPRPFALLLERIDLGVAGTFLVTLSELVEVMFTLMNKLHQQTFSIVNLAYAGVAIGLLIRNLRRVVVPRLRLQLGIVVAGLLLCVGAYVTALLLTLVFPFRDLRDVEVTLISAGLLLASLSIAYAIVRHKFLDMQNLTRRSILYGSTALVFAAFYLVVIKQITRFSANVFGKNVEVIETGFIVFSIIIFQPLLTAVEDIIEQLIRGRSKQRRVLLGDLGRLLAAEVDLRGMRERIASSLQSSLLVEPVHLWTVEGPDGDRYLHDGTSRVQLTPTSSVGRLLSFFGTSPQQLQRRDLERVLHRLQVTDNELLVEWLRRYQLLVPLVQQEEVRGVLALGPKLTGGRFHADDLALVSLLGQQITTSIENVRLVSENVQKRLLEEEISVASEIQRELLPTSFPRRPGYESHAVTFASKLVGGDYYDLFSRDEQYIHLAIADVSGKGVPAALLMSSLHAALRSNVAHLSSPSQVLGRMNRLLYEITSPEKFATFFYGILDTEQHELVYANAGHNYPLVVGADGEVRELSEGGLLLGAFPNAEYADGRVRIAAGDTLFLYTDGVTEARNGGQDDFGTERLRDIVRRTAAAGVFGVVDGVLGAVRSFTSGADPEDDVTMVVVQRLPVREEA